MSPRPDRWRRAVTIALMATLLVLVPAVASAKFGASQSAGLRVGTATMVAPAEVRGTFTCSLGFGTEAVEVRITGFTDAGPAGATYEYTLQRAGVIRDSAASAAPAQRLQGSQRIDVASTRWEVTVVATIGGWRSAETRVVVKCPFGSVGRGEF